MDVSVIIPTFNNATMLATTLSALERVNFPEKSELIVVDNNSTDNTAETIRSFSDLLPVRYVFEPKQGTSAAKNAGICIAQGELLVFTDDDVRPCPQWLSTYLEEYKKKQDKLFWGGPVVSKFEGPVPEESLLQLAPPSVKGLDYGKQERLLEKSEWFVGANMVFTSKAVEEAGGFDTTLGLNARNDMVLGGEENELQRRLRSAGYNGMYLPSPFVRHVVPVRKCTVEHIATRAEAGGRYERSLAHVESGARTLGGVPLWRYRRCAERWFRARAKRFAGRDWYYDYISYRLDKGFLLGIPGHAVKDQD